MVGVVVGNSDILEGSLPKQATGIGIDSAQHIASLDNDPSLNELGYRSVSMAWKHA